MKQLLGGTLLIVILGVGGLLYRNALERPLGEYQACTLDARVCPDGSAVGRTGPSCSFAPCPPPNMERSDMGISFVAPSGFVEASEHEEDAIEYARDEEGSVRDSIEIHRYPIEEGQTAQDVVLKHTLFSPRGEYATSLSEFTEETLGGKTFYVATIERFEAQIHTVYYLVRTNDVLAFEATDRNVAEWMNPSLDIKTLPTQAALRDLLETLQSN